MNPPIIKNSFPQGESFGRIPSSALSAINVILTDRERRLLLYYATQKTNFTPSRKLIDVHTGISPEHQSAVRKALVEKGFIMYTPPANGQPATLEILWPQIIARSKAMQASAQMVELFPELKGRIYPRNRRKAPIVQTMSANTADITYIYPSSALPNEPTLRQLFKTERLQALNSGKETLPDHEGYHEHGLDRIEDLTESQLECYLDCAPDEKLPF